jgi:hypothetical protein
LLVQKNAQLAQLGQKLPTIFLAKTAQRESIPRQDRPGANYVVLDRFPK